MSDTEFFAMLEDIHVPLNRQLQRILLAIFDEDKNGVISKEEFTKKLKPYTIKA